MGWDGSGNYNRVMDWTDDATAGIKIKSDRHDSNDDDIALALSNCITKDGQSSPTNNIPMNGKKIINLGDPADPTDAANKKYVDALRTFSTNLDLSGADANGRINFTNATGVNGIGWTGADLSWLARLASAEAPGPPVVPATINRLVLNDRPDGSGTDVIEMRENGTALFGPLVTAKGPSAGLVVAPTSSNGYLKFAAADGVAQRMILYTSGGAQGNGVLTIGEAAAAKTWQFHTNGDFYVSGAAYQTNGDINGTVWSNWGSASAFTAINSRIESRAQAWALQYANACVQQMRSAGYIEFNHTSAQAGVRATYSGYYITMSLRIGGDQYCFGFRQLQHYTPAGGWVQSTAW